jgi:hypothetical protein
VIVKVNPFAVAVGEEAVGTVPTASGVAETTSDGLAEVPWAFFAKTSK